MKASFRIGPAVIALIWDSPLRGLEHELISPFKVEEEASRPADLTFQICLDPLPEEEGLLEVGRFEDNWRLFRRREGWRLEILDQLSRFYVKQVALISEDFSRARLYRWAPSFGWRLEETITPFVQWWLTGWLALRKQGMILHGCGVARAGAGLAFIGPSGAGKTTLAQLYVESAREGATTLLNDERIVIWEAGGIWRVGGTPWSGMFRKVSPATAPLGGLFVLRKALENKVVPVPPMRLLTQLIPEAFHPVWSREGMEGLLATAVRLAEKVPAGELHFLKDSSAVDFLDSIQRSSVDPSGLASVL